MEGYREDARPKRRLSVRFKVPGARLAGVVFGIFAIPASFIMITSSVREVGIACSRNDDGSGTCVETTRYLLRGETLTFDVRSLHGAVVRRSHGRGDAYRTWLDVDGAEVAFGPGTSDPAQALVAANIDRFAHDATIASLDERYDAQYALAAFTGVMLALLACASVTLAFVAAPRRLRLDEAANLATLEQRRFIAWRHVWSVPLADVLRVRADGDTPRIVVDTVNGGAMVAVPTARPEDPAIEEIARFLDPIKSRSA